MESSAANDAPDKPHLHHAQTFPRMDEVTPFARSRARSVQSQPTPEAVDSDALPLSLTVDDEEATERDLFEKRGSSDSGLGDEDHEGEEISALSRNIHEQPEELPIELMSLTDR